MGALRQNITDRALRYRANQALEAVPHQKVCFLCGGRGRLEAGHVDGHEENCEPDNLSWTCRPCNVVAGNTLRNAGLGRKTHQFNPSKSGGASSVGEWMQAVGAITPHNSGRGERGLVSSMPVSQAVAMIRATPHHKRSEFARQLGRHKRGRRSANPLFGPGGAFGSREYVYDIGKARKTAAAEARRSAKQRAADEKRFKREAARLVKESKREKAREKKESARILAAERKRLAREQREQEREIARQAVEQVRQERRLLRARGKGGPRKSKLLSREAAGDVFGDILNPAGLTPEQAKWVKSVLSNDESSTDAELVKYFTSNGLTREKAAALVRKRSKFLKYGNPAKFDRCVKKVKARGGAADPYAVCTAAGTRNPSYDRQFLLDQATHTRNPEELQRLYNWGKKHRDVELQAAVLKRAANFGIRIQNAARRNPAAAADAGFEEFHGFPPTETVKVEKRVHFHKHLSGAGKLKALVVNGVDRQQHTIKGFGPALLCFNEAKNQLFIEGGDQALDLRDFGIKSPHELETLGKVKAIDYHTTKTHLGDEGGTATYAHQFRTTNENGQHVVVKIARYPDLIYRVLDEQMEFSGGSYTIRAEGIDL